MVKGKLNMRKFFFENIAMYFGLQASVAGAYPF